MTAVLSVTALAVAGFAVSAGVSAPAAHAASCFRDSCTGLDPDATGCFADAINVQSVNIGNVVLTQRYSPSCQANWARLSNAPVGWHVTESNDLGEHEDTTSFGQSVTWTAMVDGAVNAWACFDTGPCTNPA